MNTTLLLLLAATAEGTGVFKSFGGVRKAGSDDAGIQLDLTLYWPIRTSAEAKELEPVIIGASAMYADRDKRDDDDPAKSEHVTVRKFQDDSRHLTLNLVQEGTGGGKVILSDQSCSVIKAEFKTSKKAASYEVKIRVYGLTSKQVGELAEGLTKAVGISLVTDQQALFDDGGDAKVTRLDKHRKAIAPKLGQLVTGRSAAGQEFAGLVTEVVAIDGGGSNLVVKDVDGTVIEVGSPQVVSALTVVPPKGKTMETVIEGYVEKANKRGTRPTWGAIVQALGEVHAKELTPSESWTISASVAEAASKINVLQHEDEQHEDEPEEAVTN